LFTKESHPVSERIARRGFYVPSGLAMTNENVDDVARSVNDVLTLERAHL
jgi:perosamine synthetase